MVRSAAAADLPPRRRWSATARERVAAASKSIAGSSVAPAIRAWASAWTMRATAAAMSRLEVSASSIRSVSSLERKPRHQKPDGSAASDLRGPSR